MGVVTHNKHKFASNYKKWKISYRPLGQRMMLGTSAKSGLLLMFSKEFKINASLKLRRC